MDIFLRHGVDCLNKIQRMLNFEHSFLFENQNIKLEVNVKDETIWITANQMAINYI